MEDIMRRNRRKSGKSNNNNNDGYSLPTSDITVGTGRYRDQMTLNTGIPTGLTVNPGQGGTEGWEPLIMAHGEILDLTEVDDSVNLANKVIKDEVYWDIYYKLVNDRGSSSFISPAFADSAFTLQDFIKWVKAIASGLQVYYNLEHVIAFCGTPENRNVGLEYMQKTFINSSVRNKHRLLKEKLTRFAIPERLEAFINYMYQNFSQSIDPESPITRINYNSMMHPYLSDSNVEFQIDLAISDLEAVEKVNALISLVYPNEANRFLSGVSKFPVYDRGFATFWHNMPVSVAGDYRPKVTSKDQKVYYGVIDNNLDGLIYSMTSIRYSNIAVRPGLWTPMLTTPGMQRKSHSMTYCNGSKVVTYSDETIERLPIQQHAFPGAYWICRNGETTGVLPATLQEYYVPNNQAQAVMYHSITNMEAAVNRSVRWLFGFE
jgi:hypothetical protein